MRDNLDSPSLTDSSYRVPRQRSGGANTRRMAIVAGVIGASLLLLVGAWTLTGQRRGGGVPVLEADARPLRVKPEKAGGLDVEGKDEVIMGGGAGGKNALAPASEVPAPQALKAQASASQEPKPASAQQAALTGAVSPLPDTKPVEPKAPELKASDRAEAKPAAKAPARAGNAQVQLAAVVSEQAAMAEWQRLEKKMPDLLGGYRPAVIKVERDGKTLYRLRTGGFADTGQATSFCDKVKAHGGVCSVASF